MIAVKYKNCNIYCHDPCRARRPHPKFSSRLRPDFKTLKICSTVFSQLADRHLYSHITLCSIVDDDDSHGLFYRPNLLDFVHQVNQHPNILLFIKNIRIFFMKSSGPIFLAIISKFLPKFSRLQSIDLQAWPSFSCQGCTQTWFLWRISNVSPISVDQPSLDIRHPPFSPRPLRRLPQPQKALSRGSKFYRSIHVVLSSLILPPYWHTTGHHQNSYPLSKDRLMDER